MSNIDINILNEKFGRVDISLKSLDEYIQNDVSKERHIVDALIEIGPDILEEELLTWAYCHAVTQRDKLKDTIKAHFGEDYKFLERARLTVWRTKFSADFGQVMEVFNFLKEYESLDLKVDELTDCSSVDEMRAKLNLYDRLTNGRLSEFYNWNEFGEDALYRLLNEWNWRRGVDMFKLGDYKVRAKPGFWEHAGGFCLYLNDEGNKIVHVSGKVHRDTDIISIQGSKDGKDKIEKFKKDMGVHPANLNLLMYLKLSEILDHEKITINSIASRVYNRADKDSAFYKIPKYYFRLSVNPETNKYEFDAKKRTQILTKFSGKYKVVRETFEKMDTYFIGV